MLVLHRDQTVVGSGPPAPEAFPLTFRRQTPGLFHSRLALSRLPYRLGLGDLTRCDVHARPRCHDLTTSLHQLGSDSHLSLRSSTTNQFSRLLLDSRHPLIRTHLKTPLNPRETGPQGRNPAADRPETVRLATGFLDDRRCLLPSLAHLTSGTPPGPGLLDLGSLPPDLGRVRRLDGDHSCRQGSLLEVTRFGNELVTLTGGGDHDSSVLNLRLLGLPGSPVEAPPSRTDACKTTRHPNALEELVLQPAHGGAVCVVATLVGRLRIRAFGHRHLARRLLRHMPWMQAARFHVAARDDVRVQMRVRLVVVPDHADQVVSLALTHPLDGTALPRLDHLRFRTRRRRMRSDHGEQRELVDAHLSSLPGLCGGSRRSNSLFVKALYSVNGFPEDDDGLARLCNVLTGPRRSTRLIQNEADRPAFRVGLSAVALDVHELETGHRGAPPQP